MWAGRAKGDRGLELPQAGRIYRIVQTTGLDGKNLLKLLPVSKPSGNVVSLAQSPVISDKLKGNTSVSGRVSLNDLFADTTTSSFLNPELKMANPGKLILPKPLVQVENVKASPAIKENPTIPTISSTQNNSLPADRSSLQKDTALVSSDKSNAAYVLVKTNNLPVTVKSPVFPSGHHLQIPAHAEVKSLPASSLPPAIQQKILAAATTSNASGASEAARPPTFIYVSPVNTVKTAASKPLQNICPKPVAEVSKSLPLTMAQTAVNNSAPDMMVKSDSQKTQAAPMKWVVQENPQSSAPCLVPVKSSNNMASKIFKTLVDMKSVQSNPVNVLPASFSNLSGSQAKITSIKDNALVMYNGKVYLLTKKEPSLVSAQEDTSSSPQAHFGKRTPQLISSVADSTITNQVVNLVLSKNKGIEYNAKVPKPCDNTRPHLQSAWNKKYPHANLQISSTSQHEAISTSEPIPVRMSIDQKTVMKRDANHNILDKILALKAASAVLEPSATHSVFREEEQKIVKMNLGLASLITHRKEQQRKKYLELRKKFGLSKEERVYLRKIPPSVSPTTSEATECSSNVQISDTCKLLPTPIKPNPEEEEKITGQQEEELNLKKKAERPLVPESTKRRKTGVSSLQDSSLECIDSYPVMDNPGSPCRQVESQQENPTSSVQFSQLEDSDPIPNEEDNPLNPVPHCCKNETSLSEGSFKEDFFPFSPPDLDEIIRDEKITRLKLLLSEQNAVVEEIRKKKQQTS
ncbi:ligand-dependent nuclear receptor-interacting factor 1 isoform X2 [Hemicordylus capensis]|uniref:ligand-dependent nuclear receptor-interacting factor 1 isoform X2 n=1 Tax=Hemicordylus capensis TaxID=884348 RepID=UPI002304B04E|nr:ligand-dependent nuclear receptor-interacting factor 1 isoform X2 [Hemicordylus capensis]